MRALTGVCALVAIALAAPACGGSHRSTPGTTSVSPGPEISVRTVSSSGLILGGRVRCTASLTTPVGAGHELGVSFSLHNISRSAVRAATVEGSTGLVVKAADGTTYNTTTAEYAGGSLGGPYRTPVTIKLGARTTRVPSSGVSVRWRGPLQVIPECERTALPALHVSVSSPGPPPGDQMAIADVVAASGGLLDKCRPQRPGLGVQGEIDTPAPGGSAPPMAATCSVTLHSEGRFVVAQVLVLTPPNLKGVRVRQPYEVVSLPKLPRPYEALAWEFVVTKDGATSVAGMMRDATKLGNRMAPGWIWTGSRWSGPDRSRCGFEGLSGGPSFEFISACPS
jgi:hypothetical protein